MVQDVVAGVAVVFLAAAAADAQTPPPGSPPGAPPAAIAAPAEAPPPPRPPEFGFGALGEATKQFWSKTLEATTGAFDAGRRLTTGTMVRESRACPSSSGVPDCASAAKAVCAARGFADGRPIDTESKRSCPPQVTLGLRKAEPGECRLDHVLSSAICW